MNMQKRFEKFGELRSYRAADQILAGRVSLKLESNTYLQRRDDKTIAIRLHDTDVVTYHASGLTTLRTGGWHTVTTKDRINAYAPVRVYQRKGEWFIAHVINGVYENTDIPFIEGMKVGQRLVEVES
jgi:DNA helicase TIP49 (TBP-interacting protein)